MDLRLAKQRKSEQGGFTMIEVLIALLVLLIGMAGILSLQLTSMQATSFSRHATEASILAEDKLEALRTEPMISLASGDDRVDARGVPDPSGNYERVWTVTPGTERTTVTVAVTWNEQGSDPYTIRMSTLRTND